MTYNVFGATLNLTEPTMAVQLCTIVVHSKLTVHKSPFLCPLQYNVVLVTMFLRDSQ